jgi:hypothetical protein
MGRRLFVVTYHTPFTHNPDTGRIDTSSEAFVMAEDLPDAYLRFAQSNPNDRPKAVREAGPVASKVVRTLSNKRSLLS